MDARYRVIWAMSCVYSRGAVVNMHSHPFYHYLYVKDGDGKIIIGNTAYQLRRGCLYMMPCDTMHEISSGEGLVAYEIKFEPIGAADERLSSFLGEVDMSESGIEEALECIFREMMNAEPYYKERIGIRFSEILLLIARQREPRTAEQHIDYSERLAPILFYMQRNIREQITLKKLADVAHCERIYFLKRFKSEMGMPPMNYLRNLRINEAKKLLRYSDMNITQISSAVGFQTIHHFTAAFKRIVGLSPSEYKSKKGI
jgi:AraC-like DNA-binding protein